MSIQVMTSIFALAFKYKSGSLRKKLALSDRGSNFGTESEWSTQSSPPVNRFPTLDPFHVSRDIDYQ